MSSMVLLLGCRMSIWNGCEILRCFRLIGINCRQLSVRLDVIELMMFDSFLSESGLNVVEEVLFS